MTTYVGPDRTWDAGVPKQTSDVFNVTGEGLIVGDYPVQFVEDMPVALNQTLAAYTVVGVDGSGNIVPAVSGGSVRAIGILMYPVTTGASGALPAGRVLRSGVINPFFTGLIWGASYDTVAKKMNAFAGAPSPTQFITRPLSHDTPILP